MPDDPVDHFMVRMGRRAHAHPHPGELVRTQVGDDVLQAVVPPRAASRADAQLPQGQGHVVGDHQHPLRRNFIEPPRQDACGFLPCRAKNPLAKYAHAEI